MNRRSIVVGALAQKRGAEVASRLVSSAKSWLSHPGVDRTARDSALGWPEATTPEGVAKVSPVEASRRYLEHLREAWDSKMPDAPFIEQQVLVTVPASFDAVARELTLKAAEEAGYKNLLLLEEPQAAFYAWIERHPDWRERVAVGDLILVVDIGGGTTDFTLIAVTEQAGELALERVAVGEHILLGGDNIDLALARHLEQQLAAKGTKLDAMQLHTLMAAVPAGQGTAARQGQQEARGAGDHSGARYGTGGRNHQDQAGGRGRRASFGPRLSAGGVEPRHAAAPQDGPGRDRAALRLRCRDHASPGAFPAATGGAIGAWVGAARRERTGGAHARIVQWRRVALRHWCGNEFWTCSNGWLAEEGLAPAAPLLGEDLMHAVARGAAYYGLARTGRGVRIRGGVPRTYYVGIESSLPAVPGMRVPVKALTVAPFGMEEGSSIDLRGREFGLIVGEPAEFRFFQSAVRKNDAAGNMLDDVGEELEELSPVEVTLSSSGQGDAAGPAGEFVPVTLETVVTETGMLQLWSVARDGRRWKLEFNVREKVHTEVS